MKGRSVIELLLSGRSIAATVAFGANAASSTNDPVTGQIGADGHLLYKSQIGTA